MGKWGGQVDNQDQVQRNQEHNKTEGALYTKRTWKGEEQETDFFEPCVTNNVSQNPIWIRTVVSSWGSNDMNQLHTFCSHGLCQQNLFTELQSYTELLGTLLFRLKLPCWAHRADPRIFAPPAWNERHLEEQEYFKNHKI